MMLGEREDRAPTNRRQSRAVKAERERISMKFKGLARKLIATGAGAVIAASACGVGTAFAFHSQAYDVPTQETPIINDQGYRYATAVGQHGSAVLGEYVGLNEMVNEIYATPGNGVDTTNYMYNPYMGIFGTSANEVPDPYTANLMYNWYVEANNMTSGAAQLQKSNYAMVNLLFTSSKGSSILSDNSVSPTGTCYTLAGRPDVLTVNPAAAHQFGAQIEAINTADPSGEFYQAASETYIGDDKYAPITATYDESNAGTQIGNIWGHAQAATQVEANAKTNNLKVVTRYGDSMDTAYRYELYTKGTIYYTLSKIADGTISKKTIAYVKGISGSDKNATVTLYGEPDPNISREMAHHIECTVATANNLANLIDPEGVSEADGTRPEKMKSTTCTVEQLAEADVIILADPDNMAYNLNGQNADGTFVKPSWVKSESTGTAENDWGQHATRSAQDADGNFYYKNNFWGPQPSTLTMVNNIKAALKDLGTDKAKALADKSILSCVQEGSSSSDGGSIEAMSQYGIINAFVYPEIASGVKQYAWWLDEISHIKTDKVAGMVRLLCQDMSLADGAKLSDVDGWTAADSLAVEQTYMDGLMYYKANKSAIDNQYPWLKTTDDFDAYSDTYAETFVNKGGKINKPEEQVAPTPAPAKQAAKDQKVTVKTTSKTFKAKKLKKKAASFNIGAKASTKLTYKVTKKNKKISFKNGKVTVKKGTKKGTYKIKVKISAAKTAQYKAASKIVTIKVKVK